MLRQMYTVKLVVLMMNVTELRKEVTGLRKGVMGLKEGLAILKEGVTGLREEIANLPPEQNKTSETSNNSINEDIICHCVQSLFFS